MSDATAAPELSLVDDAATAAVLGSPLRQRLLEHFAEPSSASGAARALGVSRQLAAYHVRELERHGLLRLVREEARRGCTERILQRSAQRFAAAAPVFGRAGADTRQLRDRASAAYLAALTAEASLEVSAAHAAANALGRTLPTLGLDVDIAFASPAARKAFAEELATGIATLAAKYHAPKRAGARAHRLVVGCYPTQRETT